jgi:CubicO group peptidase (beta-lactamase class C family)
VSDVPVRVPPNIPPNIAVVGLAVIGFATSGCGEPDTRIDHLDGSDISVRAIETEIPEIMAGARLPGLQVAIIDDGRVVYSNGFGVRSTETQEPVTDRTVFAALSFSKTIFTYLVMQLADEGLMDLDRPLVSYLPKPLPKYEFYRDLEGDELHATLTARMALSHTTGLPNWRWFTPEGTLQFVFEPGERFSYSGEGIYLLQLAVEEIAGESVEELARVRIFEPLGLERTSFVFLPSFEDDYAVDHDRFLAPIGKQRREEATAAGSAQTTAEDYATFLAAVMRGEGLSAAGREELSTPQVSIEHVRMFGPLSRERIAPGDGSEASWGLGWGLVESEHGRALFHTGNDEGAANYHVAFPDRGMAVVLLGNSQTLESAAPALTELLIGDRYSPYGFLGYEPYESPRQRLVEAIASSGLQSGLEYYAMGVSRRCRARAHRPGAVRAVCRLLPALFAGAPGSALRLEPHGHGPCPPAGVRGRPEGLPGGPGEIAPGLAAGEPIPLEARVGRGTLGSADAAGRAAAGVRRRLRRPPCRDE